MIGPVINRVINRVIAPMLSSTAGLRDAGRIGIERIDRRTRTIARQRERLLPGRAAEREQAQGGVIGQARRCVTGESLRYGTGESLRYGTGESLRYEREQYRMPVHPGDGRRLDHRRPPPSGKDSPTPERGREGTTEPHDRHQRHDALEAFAHSSGT